MLVDVNFRKPDRQIASILSSIGDGAVMPTRIGQGQYLCTHWSVDQLGVKLRERWREDKPSYLDFNGHDEYGVCDSPEQAVERLGVRNTPEKLFISFVKIRRADQPREGGWRWHKWGEYIGDRDPKCEYLHDELEIDEVYTYHVYEIAEDLA